MSSLNSQRPDYLTPTAWKEIDLREYYLFFFLIIWTEVYKLYIYTTDACVFTMQSHNYGIMIYKKYLDILLSAVRVARIL